MTSAAQNSKQVLAQKGTASTPSFSFLGNNATGIYLSNTNEISHALNGTQYLTLSGAGLITNATWNGTAIGATYGGTGLTSPGANGNVLTSNGTAWVSSTPAAGVSLSANNTWTGTQTFAGTSSILASVLYNSGEIATVSATAATGTINYDVTTQSVIYYTSNASANWTVNFRASSGTSLNTAMSTGQSVTVAFLVTQGGTAYYNNVVQVDGSTVTPKYQGGTAWSAGNASSIDAYVYTIVKTGSAAFTVFASQTKFA